MLANDAAVEAITFGDSGILTGLSPGATHISCSTISVELADRLATSHAEAGQQFVSAPVFGRPEAAAAAKLFVVAAGAPAAIEAMTPIFDAVGQRTFVLGEEPRAANLVKISGNFLIASVIESVGEAMALVGKAGRRQTAVSGAVDLYAVRRPGVPDLRRAAGPWAIRTGRFRRHVGTQGRQTRAQCGRGIAGAAAGGQPVARSLPDPAGHGRR